MADVIDLTRIQETSDGDMEFEQELIEMYLEDAEENIGKLDNAIASGEATALRQVAHTLKGSSANIGAVLVQEKSAVLEKCAAENDLSQAPQQQQALHDAFAQTKTSYQNYLAEMT